MSCTPTHQNSPTFRCRHDPPPFPNLAQTTGHREAALGLPMPRPSTWPGRVTKLPPPPPPLLRILPPAMVAV